VYNFVQVPVHFDMFQVSLWGGDVSFHSLDLRLEVLEQELQLPFSFISGRIHELLIHVPWTKLASEPITITINTIGLM
jgi:vacuolar protein sorting-associated protein 13B